MSDVAPPFPLSDLIGSVIVSAEERDGSIVLHVQSGGGGATQKIPVAPAYGMRLVSTEGLPAIYGFKVTSLELRTTRNVSIYANRRIPRAVTVLRINIRGEHALIKFATSRTVLEDAYRTPVVHVPSDSRDVKPVSG